jgi:hypothetical protein
MVLGCDMLLLGNKTLKAMRARLATAWYAFDRSVESVIARRWFGIRRDAAVLVDGGATDITG